MVSGARGLVLFTLIFSSVSMAREIKHKNFTKSWNDTSQGTRCLRVEVLDDDLIHFEMYERREPGHKGKCLREDDMIWITPMVDGKNPPVDVRYFDQSRQAPYKVSYRQGYTGPEVFEVTDNGLETKEINLSISEDRRCITVFDKIRGVELTTICAEDLDKPDKRLRISRNQMTNFFGVSDQFTRTTPDGDWNGIDFDVAKKSGTLGHMRGPNFFEGAPSTSQFPIVFNLGPGLLNYGIFFDQQYRMTMTFSERGRYTYETNGDELRFFIMTGPDIKDTRKDYIELTGFPPVPPKRQFGYWTSKFGFSSFQEAEDEVKELREHGFPLDGVALDLQWFGGKFGRPDIFRMGVLQFVTAMLDHPETPLAPSFDNSDEKVPYFYDKYGVHFFPIEELYVDERLDEFKALAFSEFRNKPGSGFENITKDDGCFLARNNLDKGNGWEPSILDVNFKRTLAPNNTVWWGRGGNLDTSNPQARFFWHQLKRRWLAKKGMWDHWEDLVEPEMFHEFAYYYGFPELYREWKDWDDNLQKNIVQKHGDIHNFYGALFQPMGVSEGYENPENQDFLKPTMKRFYGQDYSSGPRHWSMFRAATVGSQRYGGLWSGDTASNPENANAQFQSQLQMSLVMDYYSGDSGGFFHINDGKTPKDPKEAVLWKQWFAASSLLDIPLRPHGWALTKPGDPNISFSAVVRGHEDSNRANVWRRYELIPYLYSNAHRAHRYAEPMYPPLFYYFQDDMNIRTDGTEKMMGSSLLFKVLAQWDGYNKPEIDSTKVYLPKGSWVDYESLEWFDFDRGGLTHDIPLFRRDRVPKSAPATTYYYLNPLFARAGAIIPKMYVDEKTMNALGKRWGEDARQELIVRVFSDEKASDTTIYEDDGVSRGYLKDEVQTTVVRQSAQNNAATVVIEGTQGFYTGAPHSRNYVVELVVRGKKPKAEGGVTVNNARIESCDARQTESFDSKQEICWYQARPNLIRARTRKMDMRETKTVTFNF